ncbi:hypothetical protein [Ekhidna sp.]|uniref:hypothetical protein n=1 Tax=Ekhidna sp. TaxID=2608089 RepID=UPI003B505353
MLAIYDGIRHNSIFYPFSFVKEVTTLLLLIVVLFELKFRLPNPRKNIFLVLFFIYVITVGTLTTFAFLHLVDNPKLSPIGMHVKTIEFFILIFLFSTYEEVTKRSYLHLANFLINAYVVYIIFSVISYFIHFPFITEFRPYRGRISSGYPTSDSQSISITLLILLFTKGQINKFILKFFVLSLGILMQATTTGFATYGFIIITVIFFGSRFVGKEALRKTYYSLFLIGLVLTIIVSFVVGYIDKKTLDAITVMVTSKSEFIIYYFKLKVFGVDSEISNHLVTATYHIRGNAVEEAMTKHNSFIELLFGKGVALAILIENQFSFLIRSYGYLGLLFYIFFIFGALFLAKQKGRNSFIFSIMAISILTLTNISQITTYLYQIAVTFSIALSICFKPQSNMEINEIES